MDSDLVKVHNLLCYSLNADASCVTVGTKTGLYVYNLVSNNYVLHIVP